MRLTLVIENVQKSYCEELKILIALAWSGK